MHGADAVVSALGPSLDREATGMPLVAGNHTIVDAMRAEGVERYIGMATPSLRGPRDARSLLGRIVPIMGRTLFPHAYRELLAMSQLAPTARSRASHAPPTALGPLPSAPATSAATASAPASPAPTSPASSSTRRPTPAFTAPRPP